MTETRLRKAPRLKHQLWGKRFGRLIVVDYLSLGRWRCRCDCENTAIVTGSNLVKERQISCGCLHDSGERAFKKHGLSHTRTFRIWSGMHTRCYNVRAKAYRDYGAKGVVVAKAWHSFECFFNDMGEAPHGLTLDRIDTAGIYEPNNCRWASFKEQSRNRTDNTVLTVSGKSQCIAAWAEETGLKAPTISRRLGLGWTPEQAVLTPVTNSSFRIFSVGAV